MTNLIEQAINCNDGDRALQDYSGRTRQAIFTAASGITSKPWFSEDRLRAGTTSRSEGCKAARSHGDLAALLSGSTRCR